MIGLVYLLVMGGHLLLSIWVVKIAIKEARKYGKPSWRYGVPVGIVMFSLLYWDLIPTHTVHRYYCLVDGGFTVNKTLEEWKRENPGVVEILVPSESLESIVDGNRERYQLNQRFIWDIYTSHHAFGVRERDERIVDIENSEILARYVDFDTDIRRLSLEPRSYRDLRLWLAVTSCEMDAKSRIDFANFQKEIEQVGR
ncbi:MAG: hypothetical protein LC541_20385 [Candidatus Thiodiazotropha sp.]|nr:hypothetical protein [Candidatus Thiodiazotropha sp.]MCM8885624.1 hypothetical protein [Candidatus Thiodiazotropha sp.]MCM8922210.1 hypothetical protein [Candidatus Thiodiazotropha sp.]